MSKPTSLAQYVRQQLGIAAADEILDRLQKHTFTRDLTLSVARGAKAGLTIKTPEFLSTACNIECALDQHTKTLVIAAQPKVAWSFGACFPSMPSPPKDAGFADEVFDTMLHGLGFNDAIWLFWAGGSDPAPLLDTLPVVRTWCKRNKVETAHIGVNGSSGFIMAGGLPALDQDPLLGALVTLIERLQSFTGGNLGKSVVTAHVDCPLAFPWLRLQLPLVGSTGVMGGKPTAELFAEVASPLMFSAQSTRAGIKAELNFPTGDERSAVIDIDIEFPLQGDQVLATGTFGEKGLPFIDSKRLPSGMPTQHKTASDQKLELDLSLVYALDQRQLTHVRFNLELDDWPVVDQLILLEHFQFDVTIFDPLATRMTMGHVDATLKLGKSGDLQLTCGGSYPPTQLYAQLEESGQSLTSLLEKIGVDEHGGVSESLNLASLLLRYEVESRFFNAEIALVGDWRIHWFTLRDFHFGVQGSPEQLGLELSADLSIGEVRFDLFAAFARAKEADGSTAASWRFRGTAENIEAGHMFQQIAKHFGSDVRLPGPLESLVIERIDVEFEKSEETSFRFECHAHFPSEDHANLLSLTLEFHKPEANTKKADIGQQQDWAKHPYTFRLNGTVTLHDRTFELDLEKRDDVSAMVACYAGKDAWSLRQLAGEISDDLEDAVPDLTISFKDAMLAMVSQPSGKATLAGLTLDADINLADLPIVGTLAKKLGPAGVSDLQIVYASNALNEKAAATINDMLGDGVSRLPITEQGDGNTTKNTPSALHKGFSVAGQLQLESGSPPEPMVVGSNDDQPDTEIEVPASSTGSMPDSTALTKPSAADAKWISIQKSLGPVYFDKIGLRYKEDTLSFLLNAELAAGGLTLDLEGLTFGSKLSEFDPTFDIEGIGIDYHEGPVEIGGMFMHFKEPAYDEYDGLAVLRTATLSLSLMGSYATTKPDPSLFGYISLDYPLGGPPFFYVEGLAGGFGYNRRLIVPPLEKILDFPLVAEAMPGGERSSSVTDAVEGSDGGNPVRAKLMREINALHRYIPPKQHQYFLTVGLRATSLEVLDSFMLLAVQFGHPFEIDFIGMASYSHPPGASEGVPVLVRVEIALRASFCPEEGRIWVRAVLTSNSHLLDPHCHLTGGFAFATWLKDQPPDALGRPGAPAGEFVITIGGYHPKFKVPSYYPTVSRLGLQWHFNSHFTIKGGLYFAMTGHVLMAGGFLDALWQSGSLQAHISAAADFLIVYKPFHYEAQIRVEVKASVTIHFFGTHHISVDLWADLQLHGPKFGGRARVHIWIASFTIQFGKQTDKPKAIDWHDFRHSFLPAPTTSEDNNAQQSKIVGATIIDGLVKSIEAEGQTHWIIAAKHLCIEVFSLIPIKEIHINPKNGRKASSHLERGRDFGIAPMDLRKISSVLKVEVLNAEGREVEGEELCFEPVLKNLPAGLWGPSFSPDVNAKKTVNGLLTGLKIKPKAVWPDNAAKVGGHHSVSQRLLAFETTSIDNELSWQSDWANVMQGFKKKPTRSKVAKAKRSALLAAWVANQQNQAGAST